MRKLFVALALILLCMSCDDTGVFDQYQSIDGGWDKNEVLNFQFEQPDTSNTYDLFVNLRNDNAYPYSNLFLIVNMNFPEGQVVTDTLEYRMAQPDGQWLGQGFTDVKENKLWYKEKVSFGEEGIYNVTVQHAMRKNGDVEGVDLLPGVLDVGFRIEKNEN